MLYSRHWASLADKPCLPWERLFAWLNSRLKHLGGRKTGSFLEELRCSNCMSSLLFFFSYLQCLKIRVATEVLACHSSNL